MVESQGMFKELDIDIVPDFKPGPLDRYRRNASFCWKKMRLFIEGESILRFKMQVWTRLESDPLFLHDQESADELRRLTFDRLNRIKDFAFTNIEALMEEPRKFLVLPEALCYYDANLMLKYTLSFHYFGGSIFGMGSKQQRKYMDLAENRELWGCFCMSEISHGSKGLRTTAMFDPDKQHFVIHTPDFEAVKCWSGGLGETATHATVFAQLLTPGGHNNGVHAFVVPIRDPRTLRPYPGISVGDMGKKVGLNAVDNGYIIFDNYRIPASNLLDKQWSITSDGQLVQNKKTKSGAAMNTLLGSRMGAATTCIVHLTKAAVIATRYSAVRLYQHDEEQTLLDRQSQQWLLLPHISAAYTLNVVCKKGIDEYIKIRLGLHTDEERQYLDELGTEIHILMSTTKPLASLLAHQGIRDCRDACGAHGYLKAAGFGELINNSDDAASVYEDPVDEISQETCAWLMQLWRHRQRQDGKLTVPFNSPLGSVLFLHDIERTSSATFTATTTEQLVNPLVILAMYEWLMCYLLGVAEQHMSTTQDDNASSMRSKAWHHLATPLSLLFIEHFAITCLWERISDDTEPQLKSVLTKLCVLFGLWRLKSQLATFYEGGFAKGAEFSHLITQTLLQLCAELKTDAVPLVDALAPPDFILNSVLGLSDGEVYKNLQTELQQHSGIFGRPSWWKEIVPKERSKL